LKNTIIIDLNNRILFLSFQENTMIMINITHDKQDYQSLKRGIFSGSGLQDDGSL